LMRHADRTSRTALIIALVDHGKDTLVDGMLKQARVFRDYQPVAERVMNMADAVLPRVDAAEGPMRRPGFVIHPPALMA